MDCPCPRPRRLLLAAVLALASAVACGGIGGDDCVNDPSARHTAKNPATGACWEFTDSCDVPADWADCGDCPGIIDCAPGYVLVGCEGVPQKVGCTSDDDCAFTQHCDFTMPPGESDPAVATGTCVDNLACYADTDCPLGQWCDTRYPPGNGGGGAPFDPPPGTCSRGPRVPSSCGDLLCQGAETCATCPGDCGTCGSSC